MINAIEKNQSLELKFTKEMNEYEIMQLIESVEENELLHAPTHMKEEILLKSKSPVIQLAIESKRVSKKVQLFWYSLKISAAVVVALTLLVFLNMPKDFIPLQVQQNSEKMEWNLTEKLYRESTQVTSILGDISEQILFND